MNDDWYRVGPDGTVYNVATDEVIDLPEPDVVIEGES